MHPTTEFDRGELIMCLVLAGLYFLLALFPLIQLIRIQLRIPEVGWSTQKLFLVLMLANSIVRVAFFALVPWVIKGHFFGGTYNYPVFTVLVDLPGVIFFSTYSLLVLFWAEIIHHAKNQGAHFTERLRPAFVTLNVLVYLAQLVIWLLIFTLDPKYQDLLAMVDAFFFAFVFLSAALGFLVYGGRLYYMLRLLPSPYQANKARKSKLKEVGLVTAICTTMFTLRGAFVLVGEFQPHLDLHYFFVGGYFLLVEVVPSLLVMFILRKLPPPRRDESAKLIDRSRTPQKNPTPIA